MKYEKVPQPSLRDKIDAAIVANERYLVIRNLYGAMLGDQMLALSPNYDVVLQAIASLGIKARDTAAETRLYLVDDVQLPRPGDPNQA